MSWGPFTWCTYMSKLKYLSKTVTATPTFQDQKAWRLESIHNKLVVNITTTGSRPLPAIAFHILTRPYSAFNISANFSAIAMIGAQVCPDKIRGITEASHTRSL